MAGRKYTEHNFKEPVAEAFEQLKAPPRKEKMIMVKNSPDGTYEYKITREVKDLPEWAFEIAETLEPIQQLKVLSFDEALKYAGEVPNEIQE